MILSRRTGASRPAWFGRPQARAFEKGVDPDGHDQYMEESATEKAATKVNALADTNTQEACEPEDEDEDEEEEEKRRIWLAIILNIR